MDQSSATTDTEKELSNNPKGASEPGIPHEKKEEPPTPFEKHLQTLENTEARLQACIEKMRGALAQEKAPDFKSFWDVRRLCLPLFKEPLPGPIRTKLWDDYIELTREGRRLKNLMDEETAFAVEQITLAIEALNTELVAYTENPESRLSTPPKIDLSTGAKTLQKNRTYYERVQGQLGSLNLFASKIHALRKELTNTEMRVRQKNAFFKELSRMGDAVFPPRKELIKEISDAFIEDVNFFVNANFSPKNFSEEKVRRSVFHLREEIKALQAAGKVLTLNTQAFSTAREQLSRCWDQLKGMEKELRKDYAEQKQQSSENAVPIQQKITDFMARYAEGNLSIDEGYKELDEIAKQMQGIVLTRNDVKALKDALAKAREPLDAKRGEEEKERRQKQAEFEKARKEKLESFLQELSLVEGKVASQDVATLSTSLEELRKTFASLSAQKVEKQEVERRLRALREKITEKQQEALLALPEGDREALATLRSLLEERRSERKELKKKIEEYRKITGGSGLDFEKAMHYNELMDAEKERLTKIVSAISDLERKIKEIEVSA